MFIPTDFLIQLLNYCKFVFKFDPVLKMHILLILSIIVSFFKHDSLLHVKLIHITV
jgi:hypothetical protein